MSTATTAAAKVWHNLRRQTRLAMALFNCGKDKVWLDPTKIHQISAAYTSACLFTIETSSRRIILTTIGNENYRRRY